jgi:hypothetical protein
LLPRASRIFFSFQEDSGPSMSTGSLGHVAISWHSQVASEVAISKHRPLFTQTRQGLEKKMMSGEYDNLCLLWGL